VRDCCAGDGAGRCGYSDGSYKREEGQRPAYAVGDVGWEFEDVQFGECGEDWLRWHNSLAEKFAGL
jgi:hypothetical protein